MQSVLSRLNQTTELLENKVRLKKKKKKIRQAHADRHVIKTLYFAKMFWLPLHWTV